MTVVSDFSHAPINNVFGTITGSAAGVRFPDQPGLMARFATHPNNIGLFFLGSEPNGCVWPLDADRDTGWIAVQNLNQFSYRNPSGTADYLYWWLQR